MILGATTITLRRPSVADTAIRASVQGVGGQAAKRERRKVYTKSELRVADPSTNTRCDQLVLANGDTYDVLEVWDYSAGPLPHYKAIIELAGEDAVTIEIPTGPPTSDYGSGDMTRNVVSVVTTGKLMPLTLAQVESSAGLFSVGDVAISVQADVLPRAPTTETTFTVTDRYGSVLRYVVVNAGYDPLQLRWSLVGRRT